MNFESLSQVIETVIPTLGPAQVLGFAVLVVVAILALDRSRSRFAAWLYTTQVRLRIQTRPRWHDAESDSTSVVPIDEALRRREQIVAVAMGQRGGR